MTTAFQPNAFQSDAFQIDGGVTSGAITGGLSYTNNNDSFAGNGSVGSGQVTGGWAGRIWKIKQKKKEEQKPVEIVEKILEESKTQKQLIEAKRRDDRVVAELKKIYAEQDELNRRVIELEMRQEQDDEEALLLLIVALAS